MKEMEKNSQTTWLNEVCKRDESLREVFNILVLIFIIERRLNLIIDLKAGKSES